MPYSAKPNRGKSNILPTGAPLGQRAKRPKGGGTFGVILEIRFNDFIFYFM